MMDTKRFLLIRVRRDQWADMWEVFTAFPGLRLDYAAPNSRESSRDNDPLRQIPILVFSAPVTEGVDLGEIAATLSASAIEFSLFDQMMPDSPFIHDED